MKKRADVLVSNEGTVWCFTPVSKKAKTFFQERVQSEPYQWLGPRLVVDHRMAEPLVEGCEENGLVCVAG